MTIKQQTAIAKIVENHGNISKSMLQAGYTPASAKNPKNLTNTKAYRSVYETELKKNKATTEEYFRNLGLGMNANIKVKVEDDVITIDEPDIPLRLQANKQAERFLFNDPSKETDNKEPIVFNKEDILRAIKDGDAVALERIVFNS